MQVFAKYWLLQLPGTAVVGAILYALYASGTLSGWLALALLGAWVAKDAALYPVLRHAYAPHGRGGAHDLMGASGVSVERIAPHGYVRLGHELWRAESGASIEPGCRVRVTEVRGLTLVVEADADGDRERAGLREETPAALPRAQAT